jgi:hypothetical protein
MKVAVTLELGGYEYSGEIDFDALDSFAAFDADEGVQYDDDGFAWWYDEDAEVWYVYDEESEDWIEYEDDEEYDEEYDEEEEEDDEESDY